MEIGEGVNSGLLGFGILNLSFTLLVELIVVGRVVVWLLVDEDN